MNKHKISWLLDGAATPTLALSEPEFRDSPKTVEKVESAVFGELPAGSRHREHEKEDGGVLFC